MACLPVCITQHIMSIFQQKIIQLAKRKEKTQSKEKTSSRTRLRYDTDMRIIALLSHSVVSDSLWPHGLQPARLLCPWDYPGNNSGVGCPALFQGIFPTQGANPGLLHCWQILYHLSHQGSPRILKCVAYPFSRASSWPELKWGFLHCRQILYQLAMREIRLIRMIIMIKLLIYD